MPTIVLADDDDAYRRLLRDVLTDEGYTVEEATSGDDALARLQHAPDPLIMFLDLFMPANGFQVIDAIVQDPALAQRHRIIVTTLARGQQIPASVQTLGLEILLKPFDLSDLLQLLSAP